MQGRCTEAKPRCTCLASGKFPPLYHSTCNTVIFWGDPSPPIRDYVIYGWPLMCTRNTAAKGRGFASTSFKSPIIFHFVPMQFSSAAWISVDLRFTNHVKAWKENFQSWGWIDGTDRIDIVIWSYCMIHTGANTYLLIFKREKLASQ